ncbi:MAG: hypothetical protein JXR76_16005 [Deltaproteobacteria bacterium]|nr:hypothetical protein [Deltaproteobacteria bacterium]
MTEYGSEEAYNRCYDDFMGLPEEKISHNTAPPEVATAEGRELALAAKADREVLISMGLKPELVDSLMDRAQAFAYSVARHHTVLAGDPEALSNWKEQYPKGYELRRYLLRFMSFGYRKNRNLLARMDEIRQGRGHRDMIADLLDLHVLGTEHPDPLREIPAFDFTKIAEAKEMYDTLGILFARASVNPQVVQVTKDTMNRAWTWYKLAADEVKEVGQFAFEGTIRYNNYVSEYRQNIRKKASNAPATDKIDTAEAV